LRGWRLTWAAVAVVLLQKGPKALSGRRRSPITGQPLVFSGMANLSPGEPVGAARPPLIWRSWPDEQRPRSRPYGPSLRVRLAKSSNIEVEKKYV
jgi:hypothetical protein